MAKKKKVQIHPNIFEDQKLIISRLKERWGYKSSDRTMREILRRIEKMPLLEAQLADLREKNEQVKHSADIAGLIIEDYIEFKRDILKWPLSLLEIEMEQLNSYQRYLREQYANANISVDDEWNEEDFED